MTKKDVQTSAKDAAVVYHKLLQLHLTGIEYKVLKVLLFMIFLSRVRTQLSVDCNKMKGKNGKETVRCRKGDKT